MARVVRPSLPAGRITRVPLRELWCQRVTECPVIGPADSSCSATFRRAGRRVVANPRARSACDSRGERDENATVPVDRSQRPKSEPLRGPQARGNGATPRSGERRRQGKLRFPDNPKRGRRGRKATKPRSFVLAIARRSSRRSIAEVRSMS